MYIEITYDDPRYIENDMLEGKGSLNGCACPMILCPVAPKVLKDLERGRASGGLHWEWKAFGDMMEMGPRPTDPRLIPA